MMRGEMSAAKQKPAEPARLTRDRIVDEALALVDREGADALTMRNLAEALLGALRASGLSDEAASFAYHANVNYVAGVSSLDAELPAEEDGYTSWRRAYGSLSQQEFPNCVAAAPYLFPSDDEQFEFGL